MSGIPGSAPRSAPSRFDRRAGTLVWWFLLPGVLVAAAVLRRGFLLLGEPHETTIPEALVLDGARRVAQGRTLYEHLGSLPFVVHVYNPLTYVVPGLVSRALGLDLRATLRVGRAISFASSLALAAVLAFFVHRTTGSRRAAGLALGGPFLFHLTLLTDFFRLRPESEGLLFTLLGIVLACGRRGWSLPAAAASFFVAFAFKQSFIAAPAATFLHLVLSRKRRDAVAFATTMGVLLFVFFAVLLTSTRGHYFEDAFVALAHNPVSLRSAFDFLRATSVLSWGLFFAALPAVVIVSTTPHRLLITYLAVLVPWSLYSGGKYGASINYWSELCLLLLVIVALAAGMATSRRLLQTAVIASVAAFACVRVADLSDAGLGLSVFFPAGQDLDAYVARIRAHEGPRLILSTRVAVHVDDVEALDWCLLDELIREGVIDAQPLLDRIRTGYYRLVVVPKEPLYPLQTVLLNATVDGPYVRIWAREAGNRWLAFERARASPPPDEGPAEGRIERR